RRKYHGFDDIFVFVPNEGLVTLASSLLATDGCLNFFAGPQDKHFSAPINVYDAAFDTLMALSGGHGFDDIFVFVPNEGLVTLASSLLATDGCLNF
ncbi:hypothetical protein AAIH16_44115, partial [Pseudomonas aeruginosa]